MCLLIHVETLLLAALAVIVLHHLPAQALTIPLPQERNLARSKLGLLRLRGIVL